MHREIRISLEGLDDEVRMACKASGIDYKDAGEEFQNFFKHVKILLEDERLPDVVLGDLGTFKSTPSSIRAVFRGIKTQIKFGNMTKEQLKQAVAKFWYPYKRIIDYRNGSGGVINDKVGVGYFWTYVPMKFSQILFAGKENINKDETGSREL